MRYYKIGSILSIFEVTMLPRKATTCPLFLVEKLKRENSSQQWGLNSNCLHDSDVLNYTTGATQMQGLQLSYLAQDIVLPDLCVLYRFFK